MARLFRIGGIVVLAAIAVVYLFVFWPMRNPHPKVKLGTGTLVIRNAKIYTAPEAAAIEHGTVLVRDGRIAAVGTDVPVPEDAQEIGCNGCVVTAGFWNVHVHFTERKWSSAAWAGGERLNAQLADMLTSHGFTTVADVGSDLRSTLSLRRRIETGGLRGPAIYTAGSAQYPPDGIPYYLKDTLPWFLLKLMPQPRTPKEAAKIEERNIDQGADLLKLFTGSYIARGRVLPMPVENAAAAVKVAHAHGQLAFSHPSDLAGVQVAMQSGVDVLAHAPAERFHVADVKGTIAPGKLADLVILDADPAADVTAFAKVRTTIRSGRVIYQR